MKSTEFARKLYIVATPIGHLGDLSHRAIEILSQTDLLLCENIQHSRKLLNHYGITVRKMAKLTDHDCAKVRQSYLEMCQGGSIAVISDAGTPLISDPGLQLVEQARAMGFAVLSVPGPSAVTAALSICPFSPVPFEFYGFLPRKKGERVHYLQKLKMRTATMVFYESPHRLSAMCNDLCAVFGEQRSVFVVKELTKRFETSWHGPLASICKQLQQANLQGEFVVIVAGLDKQERLEEKNIMVHTEVLIAEMVKAGIGIHAIQRVLGAVSTVRKNEIYQHFLTCKDAGGEY